MRFTNIRMELCPVLMLFLDNLFPGNFSKQTILVKFSSNCAVMDFNKWGLTLVLNVLWYPLLRRLATVLIQFQIVWNWCAATHHMASQIIAYVFTYCFMLSFFLLVLKHIWMFQTSKLSNFCFFSSCWGLINQELMNGSIWLQPLTNP